MATEKSASHDAAFAAAGHDHKLCMNQALAEADAICRARGVRLTRLRRRVLELIWSSHNPVGAYDLLRRLTKEHESAAPPTVYRALDFLLDQGLVHRIESRNAYVGCDHPGQHHSGQFLLCQDCGSAAELSDARIDLAIRERAAEIGFAVERQTIEVSGQCPACRNDAAPG